MIPTPLKRQTISRWSGRHFLIGIGLFFVTVFIANGVMVYYALSTFDGVETENAYRKGRAYNHVLEADAAQAALGWSVSLDLSTPQPSVPSEHPVQLTAIFKDKDGAPIELEEISLSLWRPTSQGMDVSTTMTMHTSGIYVADLILAEAGNWVARLNTRTSSGQTFFYEERLFVNATPTATTQ